MTPLSLIVSLVGFVFGFSVGQLLLRVGALVVERERVRFSWLGALTITAAVLLVLVDWLSLYDFHDVAHWTLGQIISLFILALSVCFICFISSPAAHSGELDMEAFYWHQRQTLFWAWIICELIAIGANLLLAQENSKLLQENADNVAAIIVAALPLAIRARWAQWTGLIMLIAVNIIFLIVFEPSL